jgi:phosphoglycolate phosphatase/beta-phosphoglucomutase
MVRALLFDFNGVLVADEAIHIALLTEVLRGHGLDPPADLARRFLGRPDRDCLREAFAIAERPLDDATLYRLLARKAAAYREQTQRDGYPLVTAAIQLLARAADEGRAVGIVSGALRSEIELALRQAGVRHAVKVIVAAEDVRHGKPSPEGYLRGVELLNSLPPLPDRLLHPHEVVAIEDSPAGLRAAREAGLTTLAVAGSVPSEELAEADLVVPALDPALLTRLDELVRSP